MSSGAASKVASTKWSNHTWSQQAVTDAITKSPKTIELVSKEDQVVVSVHQELLCHYSTYYSAALNGEFLEAKKNRFEVDLGGKFFQSFANWLYTGAIPGGLSVQLYIFADQVSIIALRRGALDRLAETSKGLLRCYDDVNYISKDLTHHDFDDPCPLDSDTDSDYHVANFIYEVLKGMAVRVKDMYGTNCVCCNEICQYHEHSSKEEWEATCGQKKDSKMPASLEKQE